MFNRNRIALWCILGAVICAALGILLWAVTLDRDDTVVEPALVGSTVSYAQSDAFADPVLLLHHRDKGEAVDWLYVPATRTCQAAIPMGSHTIAAPVHFASGKDMALGTTGAVTLQTPAGAAIIADMDVILGLGDARQTLTIPYTPISQANGFETVPLHGGVYEEALEGFIPPYMEAMLNLRVIDVPAQACYGMERVLWSEQVVLAAGPAIGTTQQGHEPTEPVVQPTTTPRTVLSLPGDIETGLGNVLHPVAQRDADSGYPVVELYQDLRLAGDYDADGTLRESLWQFDVGTQSCTTQLTLANQEGKTYRERVTPLPEWTPFPPFAPTALPTPTPTAIPPTATPPYVIKVLGGEAYFDSSGDLAGTIEPSTYYAYPPTPTPTPEPIPPLIEIPEPTEGDDGGHPNIQGGGSFTVSPTTIKNVSSGIGDVEITLTATLPTTTAGVEVAPVFFLAEGGGFDHEAAFGSSCGVQGAEFTPGDLPISTNVSAPGNADPVASVQTFTLNVCDLELEDAGELIRIGMRLLYKSGSDNWSVRREGTAAHAYIRFINHGRVEPTPTPPAPSAPTEPTPATGAGPAGYYYHQHYDLGFTALPDGSTIDVGAGDSHTVTLLSRDAPGGILPMNDFVTEYEGQVLIDIESGGGGNFELSLIVEHTWDGLPGIKAVRSETQLITGRELFTLHLNDFNTRSQVRLGQYRNQLGTPGPEITQELLNRPTYITIKLQIAHTDASKAFTLDALEAQDTAVTFYQIAALQGLRSGQRPQPTPAWAQNAYWAGWGGKPLAAAMDGAATLVKPVNAGVWAWAELEVGAAHHVTQPLARFPIPYDDGVLQLSGGSGRILLPDHVDALDTGQRKLTLNVRVQPIADCGLLALRWERQAAMVVYALTEQPFIDWQTVATRPPTPVPPTSTPEPVKPGEVRNVAVQLGQDADGGWFRMTWDAPDPAPQPDVLRYSVWWSHNSDLSHAQTHDVPASQPWMGGDALDRGTDYYLQVRAINAVGNGPWYTGTVSGSGQLIDADTNPWVVKVIKITIPAADSTPTPAPSPTLMPTPRPTHEPTPTHHPDVTPVPGIRTGEYYAALISVSEDLEKTFAGDDEAEIVAAKLAECATNLTAADCWQDITTPTIAATHTQIRDDLGGSYYVVFVGPWSSVSSIKQASNPFELKDAFDLPAELWDGVYYIISKQAWTAGANAINGSWTITE